MTPDERVALYVRDQFRQTDYWLQGLDNPDDYAHLRTCPSTVAAVEDSGDGRCGEGTCEELYIEAVMHCDHGNTWDFDYHEGGEMADLIAQLDKISP